MTAALRYTSSTQADNALRIARVAAAGRVQADRLRDEAQRAALVEASRRYADEGQIFAVDPWDVDYCFICNRCTDHLGEHTPEQIAAWQEGRAAA
jgi:hypothetical protein